MKELDLQNCRLDGRYDVQELLGRGSYAEIYVARDILAAPHAPHGLVVIKALNVFLQNDLDADLERTLVENFQNEAIALDRVRHPNIISRLGHGTAKDLRGTVFHYLVLEYLPGGDLARVCGRQGLPLETALKHLEQVCAGLSFAHSKGVIHRDIKPQNLLLTRDRQTVKIADFGVARITQNDSPITRVGTNVYAPPEHSPNFSDAENGVLTVTRLTPAADIYSLAKSAYVLLTGESPRRFSGAPISDLPEQIRIKPWANALLRVLEKATRSNPPERYQTVNDFWKDLGKVTLFEEPEETVTEVSTRASHPLPQPSVSADFSPIAPLIPRFNTSRDLKYENGGALQEKNPRLVVKIDGENPVQPSPQPRLPEPVKTRTIENAPKIKRPRKPLNKTVKRAMFILVFLTMFAGALLMTQNYFRNHRIMPEISNPFKKPEGVAIQDINLRSTAGVENPPVGLVPKGSRVRVVNSKDNWYEIDITEFSRPKDNPTDAEHGWVNKRYIDIQE
ncbi:MAG: protein kinase domain-containing protein [Pyrinomonadaceae bacterium]